MKPLLQLTSAAGLALTVVPSLFVFAGTLSWATHVTLMAVGAVLWFATAPFWMRSDLKERARADAH